MPRYHYEAKSTPSQRVEGTVVAESRKSAIDQVFRMGHVVISLAEETAVAAEPSVVRSSGIEFRRRVGLREVAGFTRQLADLLEAGVPIIRSLDLLQQQMKQKKFRAVGQELRDACSGGQTLSAALSVHPQVFSRLYVVMVRAAEGTGTVEQTLKRLSEYLDRILVVRSRVLSALAYPAFMAVVGAGTVLVLLGFVVPRLTGVFEDMGRALPLPTQLLLAASRMVTGRSLWLVPAVLVLASVPVLTWRTRAGASALGFLRSRAPIFGPLFVKIETARFSHTLAVLLENGVPILEAIRVTSDVVQDGRLKRELDIAQEKVRTGSRFSEAMTGSRVLSPFLIEKIAVGEEAGRLEKTLHKVAETEERESEEAMKVLLSLLEPAMILVLGCVVAFIVIAILLPIFEMSLIPT